MSRAEIPSEVYSDWFDLKKPIRKIEVRTHSSRIAQAEPSIVGDGNSTTSSHLRSGFNAEDYALHYQNKEVAKTLKNESRTNGIGVRFRLDDDDEDDDSSDDDLDLRREQNGRESRLSDIETNTVFSERCALDNDPLNDESTQMYGRYNFLHRSSTNCSIAKHKEQIIQDIEDNPVVIIQAGTGSGKTTQVPQYILDSHVARHSRCNIVVTQPRRIAAMSIAKRVCKERGWPLGSVVGYQVGLDNCTSPDTRLAYVTTGVLLQKLLVAKNLSEYTHILLDEVHERDMEMDFLMLVVRKLARHVSRSTKIILMSATFDADQFAQYFSMAVCGEMQWAKINTYDERSFPVTNYYIEELVSLGPLPVFDASKPSISQEAIVICQKLIAKFDYLELMEQKCTGSEFAKVRHTVLVFLPGIEEIHRIYKALNEHTIAKKWNLLALHSMVPGEDQSKAFDPAPPGFRKIILATNIAESSITVPDIKYVIDFCLTKNQVCDRQTHYSSLELEWASKSNCLQRRGRAGRCDIGRAYLMVTEEFYKCFAEFGTPEMQRCALDQIVLKVKILDMGAPKSILALAMDPPNLQDIEGTILTLMEVGALTAMWSDRGIVSSQDGDLTYVGRVLSSLPIDIHLGKLVVLGHAFGCLEECIIMAAGLSQKSIFAKPYVDQLDAYKHKLSWADGSFSDCIAILNIYTVWKAYKDTDYFRRPGGISEKEWGIRYYVQVQRLKEVQKLVEELTKRLIEYGIIVPRQRPKRLEVAERNLLLKMVLAGAFYPHYFTQAHLDEEMVAREISGYDMLKTVVLSGLPLGQSILYSDEIEQGLKSCGTLAKIHFENSSSRAYVVFKRTRNDSCLANEENNDGGGSRDSKIAPEIYLAVKKRLLRSTIIINLYSSEETKEQLRLQENMSSTEKKNGITNWGSRVQTVKYELSQLNLVELPDLSTTSVELRVGHFLDCGHFWAQYGDLVHQKELRMLKQVIDRCLRSDNRPISGALDPGMLVLAPYRDLEATQYYRAIVEKVTGNSAEVFFIDYGNAELVNIDELREIDPQQGSFLLTHPKQAFECYLSNLKPCAKMCINGVWSSAARKMFQRTLDGVIFIGRIYSVIHEVVRLEVIYKLDKSTEASLNEELIKKGFAERAQEDFLSKENFKLRCRARSEDRTLEEFRPASSTFSNPGHVSTTGRRAGKSVPLKGPRSPLEMSFQGLSRGTVSMGIRIEPDSVNSVALNSEPQDKHARLIVASDLNIGSSGNSITARATTFFPNIPGLLHIVCLIYSPKVEFRTDPDRTCYTGALCGLGYHKQTGESIYKDHEIELSFDIKFATDDIQMINDIRLGLNVALGCFGDQREDTAQRLSNVQKRLQENILRCVRQRREGVDPLAYLHAYKWQRVKDEDRLIPDWEGFDSEDLPVLPLLCGIQLRDPEDVQRESMLKHIRDLYNRASESEAYEDIHCRLCNVYMKRPKQLLFHLALPTHRERQQKLIKRDQPAH